VKAVSKKVKDGYHKDFFIDVDQQWLAPARVEGARTLRNVDMATHLVSSCIKARLTFQYNIENIIRNNLFFYVVSFRWN
jgi:hypothetical protein